MKVEQNFDQILINLVSESLEVEVDMESSADNIAAWDSLGRLSIMSALDKATGGEAGKLNDLARCDSMSALKALLEKNSITFL